MMEKNNKWTERFTQWITCTIRYHCHKADRPTASNNHDWLFLWFCGLFGCGFLRGLCQVCILLGPTWTLRPLAGGLSLQSSCPGPPFRSSAGFSLSAWRLGFKRECYKLSALFTSCLVISDHMTKPRVSVGKSYTKVWILGVEDHWRSQWVTVMCLPSVISMMRGNVITKHNWEVNNIGGRWIIQFISHSSSAIWFIYLGKV